MARRVVVPHSFRDSRWCQECNAFVDVEVYYGADAWWHPECDQETTGLEAVEHGRSYDGS